MQVSVYNLMTGTPGVFLINIVELNSASNNDSLIQNVSSEHFIINEFNLECLYILKIMIPIKFLYERTHLTVLFHTVMM
jgi:hypothetical protein